MRNVSLLVAISVDDEGYRQILGMVEGAKEGKAGWSAFLNHLKGRGLRGVQLITSDARMDPGRERRRILPQGPLTVVSRIFRTWYGSRSG